MFLKVANRWHVLKNRIIKYYSGSSGDGRYWNTSGSGNTSKIVQENAKTKIVFAKLEKKLLVLRQQLTWRHQCMFIVHGVREAHHRHAWQGLLHITKACMMWALWTAYYMTFLQQYKVNICMPVFVEKNTNDPQKTTIIWVLALMLSVYKTKYAISESDG